MWLLRTTERPNGRLTLRYIRANITARCASYFSPSCRITSQAPSDLKHGLLVFLGSTISLFILSPSLTTVLALVCFCRWGRMALTFTPYFCRLSATTRNYEMRPFCCEVRKDQANLIAEVGRLSLILSFIIPCSVLENDENSQPVFT